MTGAHKTYLSLFYVSLIVCLVPKFLVSGVLTSLPVVSYNDFENLNFRFYTIPADDFIYFFGLFIMNITLYEFRKQVLIKVEKNDSGHINYHTGINF
ncbi:MAG: lycopene cyclase domain-containing protein [Bacteroidales bacterium]|nr:lycopene cyclase domain-containing protein [Bacteroidales bacterium]